MKIAPAIAMPQDIPICLVVEIIADAVLNLSLDTEPITELKLGEAKIPHPMPRATSLNIISTRLDSGPRVLSRKRARQIKVIPTVHSILGPVLSDSQPLNGATTALLRKDVARSNPESEVERPSPFIR